MILFLIGIIEMAISASWTRYVSNARVASAGMITGVNIFIWYYVIEQVVNHIDSWVAIIPYAGGCAIGAMIGASNPKAFKRTLKKGRKLLNRALTPKARRRKPAQAEQAEASWDNVYEILG